MPQQALEIGLLLRSEVPPKKTIRLAQEAEDYGVDYITSHEHMEPMYRDPLVSMTLVASNTQRVKIGPLIISQEEDFVNSFH